MNTMTPKPAPTIWQGSELLECFWVIPEIPNTASFTFRAPSGALFDYLPGQFLTLEIPVPGGPVHRTYTISSSPHGQGRSPSPPRHSLTASAPAGCWTISGPDRGSKRVTR